MCTSFNIANPSCNCSNNNVPNYDFKGKMFKKAKTSDANQALSWLLAWYQVKIRDTSVSKSDKSSWIPYIDIGYDFFNSSTTFWNN